MGTTELTRFMGGSEIVTIDERWNKVREGVQMAIKAEHLKLASQVMVGFFLAELKKDLGIKRGGLRQSNPNHLGLIGEAAPMAWPVAVKINAGISDETASNWMKMAEGVKKRFKDLPEAERFRELVLTPPSQWSTDDRLLLEDKLRQITDGRSQMEFMFECGLTKKPKAKGGARDQTRKVLTPGEELAEARRLAEADWVEDERALEAYHAKFTLLDDSLVDAQIAALQRHIEARMMWLRMPQTKRDPQAIEKFLKAV